jgi:hypothetical protein
MKPLSGKLSITTKPFRLRRDLLLVDGNKSRSLASLVMTIVGRGFFD